MIRLTYGNLKTVLDEVGVNAWMLPEISQLYAPLTVSERKFHLFVRIFDKNGLIQLLVFLPCVLTEAKIFEVGRLLHVLNKDLDIPGYCMDETVGLVFFRCIIPSFHGVIEENIIKAFISTCKQVCEFSLAFEVVSDGTITLEQLLEKTVAAQKEANSKQAKAA